MQNLPSDFLTKLAREYNLSELQRKAFVELYSCNKNSQEIANSLHISISAFENRMSGVYQAFRFTGKGPGKKRKLHDWLILEYQKSNPTTIPHLPEDDIDELVKTIRDKIRKDIQKICGTIRVLDMTQPIELGSIYTKVNILERVISYRRLSLAQLLEQYDIEDFDRFGLGKCVEKKVDGLEAVDRYPNLLILGKPGIGKTTFLKHIAIHYISEESQKELIPIFIPLKVFAEKENKPNPLEYIIEYFSDCGVNNSESTAKSILTSGRILILLDGLDEVREEDYDRVLKQVKEFQQKFNKNNFIITCRIAAREYDLTTFTEVEIADFEEEQIRDFVSKWFEIKNNLESAKNFMKQLKENRQIKELATNPLLLTLLCLEFEDAGDFPNNRAELYERATATLLRKWDAKREIQREQIYKQLSVKRKEDLLSQIAFSTFDRQEYFFKKKIIENYIARYICNLPNAPEKGDKLDIDSEAVLKSIEAQHGLLVERARGIYSFSHLTFQEYFTARRITNKSNPKLLDKYLKELVEHITEKRWREVFLLTAGLMENIDLLLELMKQEIDGLIAKDEKLQEILRWAVTKSESINVKYKPEAVRAFYLGRHLYLYRHLYLDLYLHQNLDRNLDRNLKRNLDLDLDRNIYLDLNLHQNIYRMINNAYKIYGENDFVISLKELKDQLPDLKQSEKEIKQWWKSNEKSWKEKLRSLMIEYRNIGHDWQLTQEQEDLFITYWNANKLLIEILKNEDFYASREVRESIENSLFLPVNSKSAELT